MSKQKNKDKKPITRETLKFMLKLVWKEKPHLFFLWQHRTTPLQI